MCLSAVYSLNGNEKKLIQENVAGVRFENGKLILINILGVKTEINAEIDCIDLMENIIIVKMMSA
ncbi:MAG: CooT family nickel-binding protein [Oscillospiraceae bacterium]|nr:CooT family nickel-binding protein [Oscillospiraceae bacterium]